MQSDTSRIEAGVLGAIVADSAAMGLHWIYDTGRLADVGGDRPEFHEPDAENYQGVVGVFAHGGRPVGSLTRYGATVQLVAERIAADGGSYRAPAAAAQFLATFGYGGSFVGYVDHPAAGALDVIRARDAEIEASFRGLADHIPFRTIVAIGPLVQEIASDREIGDAETRLSKALEGFPEVSLSTDQMKRVIDKLSGLHEIYWSPTGVSDLQLPVLAPVIPVALAGSARGLEDDMLMSAARGAANLTHVDEDALAVGDFVAVLIRDLISGEDLWSAVDRRLSLLPDGLAGKTRDALSADWDNTVAAAGSLGISCSLAEGLPLSLVTLKNATSYVDAVRTTILCGGDSCGRGLIVGALAGLLWGLGGTDGIPSAWIDTVYSSDAVSDAARALA